MTRPRLPQLHLPCRMVEGRGQVQQLQGACVLSSWMRKRDVRARLIIIVGES